MVLVLLRPLQRVTCRADSTLSLSVSQSSNTSKKLDSAIDLKWLIVRCVCAATSGRLMQARTDLLLVVVEQLQKEGVLYSLPPYQDGSSGGKYLPEDGDPNVEPQNLKNSQ